MNTVDAITATGIDGPTVDDGELIETCLLVTKIVEADGDIRLALSYPPSMSWVDRLGMLRAALIIEEEGLRYGIGDDNGGDE
jgi:hypothetical protein